MLDSNKALSHLVDIRVRNPSVNGSPAVIESMELRFLSQLKVDDVSSMDWQSIEQAVLDMRPTEKLHVYAPGFSVFEWFLDAVSAGKILSRLCHPRKVEIVHAYGPLITAEKILRVPSTYAVDGQSVQLKRPQIIRLAGCKNELQRQTFLREVLASTQAAHPQA